MRIETDDRGIFDCLADLAGTITAAGGFVADDLIVRCVDGEFSCAVGAQPHVPDRILVDYPRSLAVPLHELDWDDGADGLALVGGSAPSKEFHGRLLDSWLEMVDRAGKLEQIRRRVPSVAITDPALREHLAAAGYPAMRAQPASADARDVLMRWHCVVGPANDSSSQQLHLVPLKHLVNHHPTGAPQGAGTDGIGVVTSAASDGTETHENYGDLDMLQLAMLFGYVDPSARPVHSVPTSVDSPIGPITVVNRRHRSQVMTAAPEVPVIDTDGDGLRLRDLSFRSGGRPRVEGYLAMAVRARTGADEPTARALTTGIVDDLIAANVDYHSTLAELLPDDAAQSEAERLLASVAHGSRARLERWARGSGWHDTESSEGR